MDVKIIDYDHLGRGIAKINNKVIFIPKVKLNETLSIDIIKEKKNYALGRRVTPLSVSYCPYYFYCGGCNIGHLNYIEQLEFKRNTVKNIFHKYTKYNLDKVEILKTNRYNYRNKVTLHIENNKLGYYCMNSNELVAISKCSLLDDSINNIIKLIKEFIDNKNSLSKAVIKSLDSNIMLVLEGNEDAFLVKDFFKGKVSSLYYNGKFLSGNKYLIATILGKRFTVRKDSFFQVNNEGINLIYDEVIKLVKEVNSRVLFDLYCGTGTISLLVSDYVDKVIGIEVLEDAILDAKNNCKLNCISNVDFYLGNVSSLINDLDCTNVDTVILDPPRSGVSRDVISFLLNSNIKNIIYVSCNPLTLARDINMLDLKYELKSLKLVDEFPNTYHVECVCLLESRKVL